MNRLTTAAALAAFLAACGGAEPRLPLRDQAAPVLATLAGGPGPGPERLRAGEADSAFLAVRPPGHHATPSRAMGFCLLNNVAVAAGALAEAGERVLVVDIDAHHGNGTQDAFWDEPRVTYLSVHEHPMYPGTGMVRETGGPNAPGGTINVPVPASTSGDVYRRIVDEVIVPVAERVAPTWLLLSTGFDAHRNDPLTDLGLSAGDYYDLTVRILATVPAGRRVAFLEGGYDLDAIVTSTAATLAALCGVEDRPEPVTSDPADARGLQAVGAARLIHDLT